MSASTGTAHASTLVVFVKQGSDSGELRSNGWIEVCDKEADGHGAYMYLNTETGEDRKHFDRNGSAAGCSSDFLYADVPGLEYIKVCEQINNAPDKCSDRVNISYGD
ncbi:hypothetical protein [Streptomyces sp. NBC_00140]|uniref:hypothetical protein n=1 Tax=Streptomyces sp. NBC_00140 TaxID=2975664 RepID=UPI00225595BA|nr:hypothetical protein [Streptomyces sp. NBC_00140]MCX5328197.1 hypothetical protein [Streptomyces sp. NBC_00140]